MTLVINRPCERCVHVAICRIRDRLDSVLNDTTEVIPPVVDDAMTYDVAVEIRCAHFLPSATTETPAFYSSKYASDIPGREDPGEAAEADEPDANLPGFLERTFGSEPAPLTVERLQELGHAPPTQIATHADKNPAHVAAGRLRALKAVRVKCDPGCGGEFLEGPGLSSHRRNCAPYQAYRSEHVREVAPLPGAIAPAATADALAGREADDARRRESARAKADETWRQRHGQA